jgi:excisionase family DNA binding protein
MATMSVDVSGRICTARQVPADQLKRLNWARKVDIVSPASFEATMQAEDLPSEHFNSWYPAVTPSVTIPTFYTVADIATMTGLSTHTVRRAIAAGTLRACKLGHSIRVRIEDYEAWINSSRLMPVVWTLDPVSVASDCADYRW